MFVVRCCLLVAVVCLFFDVARCSLSFFGSLFVVRISLFVVCGLLRVVGCLFFVVRCSLFVGRCLLFFVVVCAVC